MSGMIYDWLKDMGAVDWAVVVIIVSLFIDLTPGIKFNPVQFVIKHIGSAFNNSVEKKVDAMKTEMYEKIDTMNKQMDERIDDLDTKLDEVKEEQQEIKDMQQEQARSIDESEVNRLKCEILSFSNSLICGSKHTTEEYHTVMDQYTSYHKIIAKYDDMSNGKIEVEYENIVSHYTKHEGSGEYMF